MMQKAAMEAGLTVAALFAISMYCIQVSRATRSPLSR